MLQTRIKKYINSNSQSQRILFIHFFFSFFLDINTKCIRSTVCIDDGSGKINLHFVYLFTFPMLLYIERRSYQSVGLDGVFKRAMSFSAGCAPVLSLFLLFYTFRSPLFNKCVYKKTGLLLWFHSWILIAFRWMQLFFKIYYTTGGGGVRLPPFW
jgi:hypothetical protein